MAVATVACLAYAVPACAATVGIQGTMSNFDVFNETGTDAYGAELDLEGCHATDITKTYPSHFNNMAMTEYSNGATFGTRLTFTGYNFTPPTPYITPRVGQSTNGHFCVNLPGCEHFGFAVRTQPTATRYYWLDQSSNHIGSSPMSIPGPTWTYVPAAAGKPAVVQAVLAPVPKQNPVMYADAVWVKTYVTEISRQVDLEELISSPPEAKGVAPQLPSEVEAEWDLLPGDQPRQEADIQLGDADQAVLRRYEYYQYTGGYDELHLPTSSFTGGTPPNGELGQFIAANMVAANLEAVPEPSTVALLFAGAGVVAWATRRRGNC